MQSFPFPIKTVFQAGKRWLNGASPCQRSSVSIFLPPLPLERKQEDAYLGGGSQADTGQSARLMQRPDHASPLLFGCCIAMVIAFMKARQRFSPPPLQKRYDAGTLQFVKRCCWNIQIWLREGKVTHKVCCRNPSILQQNLSAIGKFCRHTDKKTE